MGFREAKKDLGLEWGGLVFENMKVSVIKKLISCAVKKIFVSLCIFTCFSWVELYLSLPEYGFLIFQSSGVCYWDWARPHPLGIGGIGVQAVLELGNFPSILSLPVLKILFVLVYFSRYSYAVSSGILKM